ncbi:MAG: hypothetical protein ACOX7R_07550 [Acetivibrionales bacterium]
MKRTKTRCTGRVLIMAFVLAIVLATLLPTAVFAANGKTVEVKGYIWEGMTEEDIANVKPDFSVSNVVNTFDAKQIDPELDAGLIAESPAVVTVLEEGGVIFDVYKLTKKEDNTYEYRYDESYPVSGQVRVYVLDEAGALDENGYPLYVEKTIDASELDNYEVDLPYYLPGCAVTLTEPGDYFVTFRYEAIAGATQAFITIKDAEELDSIEPDSTEPDSAEPTTDPAAEPTPGLIAEPTASKVLVNGGSTSFDAYNIDGSNYFKLRDLANVVSGTEKQFDVVWDGEKKVINLISNKAYTVVGGEMAKGDGKAKTAIINTSKIYRDGAEIELTAYTISGNNYFKLRDIAKAFDIGVTWDGATSTVSIDTSTGYVE